MPAGFRFANYPITSTGPSKPPDDAPALVRMRLYPRQAVVGRNQALSWFPMQVYYGGPTVMRAATVMSPFLVPWAFGQGYRAAIESVPITPNGMAGLSWPHTDFQWHLVSEAKAEPRYQLAKTDATHWQWQEARNPQQHGEWSVAGIVNQVGAEVASLFPYPGLKQLGDDFRRRILEVANELGADPNHMLAIMQLESGMLPWKVNPLSQATGLIQFMPSTAKKLGTSVQALRTMSATEQLGYVLAYYKPFRGQLNSPGALYMATFMPAYLNKPSEYVLAREGDKIYDQNKALDTNQDGLLTVGDVTQKAENMFRKYAGMPPIAVPPSSHFIPIALGVAGMAVGLFAMTVKG